MILPVEKTDAGKVFVPQELHAYAKSIYQYLGMHVDLTSKSEPFSLPLAELTVVTDELQRTVLIQLMEFGEDLEEQIRALMREHTEKFWTYQIAIPSNDGRAITAYEKLISMGFFFTGIKAACGKQEQFYMQWCGDLELYMEDYVLTDAFDALREQITDFYDRRKRV